jgi:hypothetical protein
LSAAPATSLRSAGHSPDPAEQETIMMEEWNKNRSLQPDRTELAPHTEDESVKRREREAKRKQKLDEQLDQGLEDTFPGSDLSR